MKNIENKLSGSYYTPNKTIRFMKKYLYNERKRCRTILEPSSGDGRFIDEFYADDSCIKLVAIEKDNNKVKELRDKEYPLKVQLVNKDFLDFIEETNQKFELIIGNPPYINIKNMDKTSLDKAKMLCEKFELSDTLMKNIWVVFLLGAISCLEKWGTIFFVLPMEFLQVVYAQKVRNILEEYFTTIHILSFKEKMFPKIEQETCLVYLTNELNTRPNINFKIYERLDSEEAIQCSVICRNKPLNKWTNAILSDQDIDLLEELIQYYKKISDICDASPGIVTGANNEFILTSKQVKELRCQKYILPIIAKSIMLKGKFILDLKIIGELDKKNERIYLLDLSKRDYQYFSEELKSYLSIIENKKNTSGVELKNRYKCKSRNPWYGVPIISNGDLFFFKRYDKLPRICINSANLYTTDIAYNMRMKDGYNKESAAFCFYNSLTLTQCEYYGRYYAGGVCELIPSEFKELAMPYYDIDKKDVLQLNKMFEENADIIDIIKFVDSKTIYGDFSLKTISELNKIREKLMARRIKR